MAINIFVSNISHGSMKDGIDNLDKIMQNQINFLKSVNINPLDTTKLSIIYDKNNFTTYKTIDSSKKGYGITKKQEVVCDALVVTKKNHAIFLPLADCVGAIIYDKSNKFLMVSHLGRHSLEQNGGVGSIKYLVDYHNADPNNILVWLSPAAGKENYPLYSFKNKGLHEVAKEQFISAGILNQNITISPVDTAKNLNYFSHSQYIVGKRQVDGRFAIVAIISN